MVLLMDEYRESVDIDFLCSDLAGYRELRQLAKTDPGLDAWIQDDTIKIASPVRTDQYGIRTMLQVDGAEIKFEIISEGRIALDSPQEKDQICGISTLTPLDMAASKLLANSDRWADPSTYSRDIIDLAMLNLPKSHFQKALEKATGAYGKSVRNDLDSAIEHLRKKPQRLEDCMVALNMDTTPKALLWERIRSL